MLAPDPKYLFLGKSHEEAIAHLVYAVSEGEGFVSLIGEKGVGKTTICRAFIEGLDQNTEVAFIINPELSPEDLLKKINTEFNINATARNVKELIDALNLFLMEKRREGKKVVLFIDEAQNLKGDALEQVRLLSNLETSRDKLLQIVLVGESKLAEMLGSYELRQIGQRVSVSYTINPLTHEETCEYIRHRIKVASQGPEVQFDQSAFRQIFKYSHGIPRLINIACDKSLFRAFRLNVTRITGDIAKAAVLDLTGRADLPRFGFLKRRRVILIAAGCCLLSALLIIVYLPKRSVDKIVAGKAEVNAENDEKQESVNVVPASRPAAEPVEVNHESILKPQNAAQAAVETAGDPVPDQEPAKNLQPSAGMSHSVQVGAFFDIKNAETLLAELREKGYPARIVPVIDSRGRTWYTVRIGDYPSREVARRHSKAFSSREKMESIVRPFGKL